MNQFRMYINQAPAAIQLLMLFALSLVGAALFTYMAFTAIQLMYGLNWEQVQTLAQQTENPEQTGVYKIFQLFVSAGFFLIPAMIFSQLQNNQPQNYLQLDKRTPVRILAAIILLFVALTPITDAFLWLNQQISLPGFLASFEEEMLETAKRSQGLVSQMIQMDSVSDFLINLLIMAALPAIAEEFFFRGVIQRIMMERTQKVHLSVWVTALAFALMHQQFFTMLPLLALGALMGYLKVWTGSLWAPMIAHFVNNALIVVVMFFFDINLSDLNELNTPQLMWLLPSLVVCSALALWIFRNSEVNN